MTGGVLPGRAQLLHLLGRVERRVLTSGEAALLRVSVARLLDAVSAAGMDVAVARAAAGAEVAAARGELAEAREMAAVAVAERDAVLAEAGAVSPVRVACPTCGAGVGARCRALRGVKPPQVSHVARRRAVGRVLFAEALAEAGEQR